MHTPAICYSRLVLAIICNVEGSRSAHLLRQGLHVFRNQRVTCRVVQRREAPRIPKGYKVRLSGVKVDEERLGACAKQAHAREVVDAPAQTRLYEAGPQEIGLSVATNLEIGEEALDGLCCRGEEIYSVHLGVVLASLLDAFDGCG